MKELDKEMHLFAPGMLDEAKIRLVINRRIEETKQNLKSLEMDITFLKVVLDHHNQKALTLDDAQVQGIEEILGLNKKERFTCR